jgi:negative regulator of flagellin synthesis FlgM
MSIGIDGTSGPPTPKPGTAGSVRTAVHGTPNGTPANDRPTGTDTVSVTATASLLQRLDAKVSAAPVIDTARVNRVRNDITEGRFAIDPARVAEKLIKFELAIASRGIPTKA